MHNTLFLCGSLSLQALYDVMVEAVFPTCAIFIQQDSAVRRNKVSLSRLASGKAHSRWRSREFMAGSRVEGLAMDSYWGHPWVDVDCMLLLRGQLGVCLPNRHGTISQQSRGNMSSAATVSSLPTFRGRGSSCLEYAPQDCQPAYCKLRVTDTQALLEHPFVHASCIDNADGHHWLNARRLKEEMMRGFIMTTGIQGPAGQAAGGLFEYVPTLVAGAPHPAMDDYFHRPRKEWPPQDQLEEVWQLPMCLALVGHKGSDNNHREARHSWSPSESILISELPAFIKQGCIAFKYTFKAFPKDQIGTANGRSRVGSYHLKTTCLHYLEKTPPSSISSPYSLMISLLNELANYLTDGKLPHYFLPECDLLESVGYDEQLVALQAVEAILSDPVVAVLKCPSNPSEIFGDISPDDLVGAFRGVSTHPSSERNRKDLLRLLSRMDEWRHQRYCRQLKVDEDEEEDLIVSGRPALKGLMGMMEQTKHLW